MSSIVPNEVKAMASLISKEVFTPELRMLYSKVALPATMQNKKEVRYLCENANRIFVQVQEGTGWFEWYDKLVWTTDYFDSYEFLRDRPDYDTAENMAVMSRFVKQVQSQKKTDELEKLLRRLQENEK